MFFRLLNLVILVSMLSVPALSQTDAQREAAAKLLDDGKEKFLKLIESVTEEQWNFRLAAAAHTIGEEAEHITLSENELPRVILQALRKAPEPKKAKSLKDKETKLRAIIFDKEKAPESYRTANKLVTKAEVLELYGQANRKLMKLLRESEELDTHVRRHPNLRIQDLTALQWFYYIAYHRERHIAQIEVLLAHPDLPGRVRTAD